MRLRLQNFDGVRDRQDPRKAKELFDLLWPARQVRLACAARLAKSIRYAHDCADGSWSVTMLDWGVRLNVGQVLVLQLASDQVLVYVRTARGKPVYAAVRSPSRVDSYTPNEIADVSAREWQRHAQFIGDAAEAKKGSPWRTSFSEGVLEYVESTLHTSLPRPSYLKSSMHILQGGVSNGDKDWLVRAARRRLSSPSWIAPRSVRVGDEVVIYVTGFGFFATARISGNAKRRANWARRYGAPLERVRLIDPPISLGVIRASIPDLEWAKYPRSITTLNRKIATQVAKLIKERRKVGILEIADSLLQSANLAELRRMAYLSARPSAKQIRRMGTYRQRSQRIHQYVLLRAEGVCEGCKIPAPFRKPGGRPYLEPHHTKRLADEGPDHPKTVIALCPNCHRRAHSANDAAKFNQSLMKKLTRIEMTSK